LAGLSAKRLAGAVTHSANVCPTPPAISPNTASPGLKSVTPSPTASTTPEQSLPGIIGMRWPGMSRK
jgi:hypothetical protein